ncbi:MAG: cytochrome c oxidase assembly protein [Alphaproteobacteria bacterium]|nr:MAG: cytochrome c oxidase assembly protein [Alphaproteobacteria bacterium]
MPASRNARTVLVLVGVLAFMGSASFMAVPFYNWFCRVTGYGGTPKVAEAGSDRVLDREITIKFDANTDPGLPWEFRPVTKSMKVKIGETGLAFFEAHNPTDEPIAGQAAYNVFPFTAGYYFNKVQCFCFTEQVLQPGETVQMPVSFYVDPEIVDDPEAKYVNSITLSYTFYRIELPQAAENGYAAQTKTVN